jgi:predicted dehydrogenase
MPGRIADSTGIASRRVGIGLVGCGHIAAFRHLPALASLRREAEIVAIADDDAEALSGMGERLGLRSRHRSVERLLEDPAVDAVAVLVPPEAHAEVAAAALSGGKHVLVEKPLALTVEDCDRVVEAGSRHPSAAAMVAFNLRFHRLVRAARTQIAAGKLGAIETINTVTMADPADASGGTPPPWKLDRGRGGGALIEQGVHHFDLWRFLTGDEVAEVSALTRVEGGSDRISTVAGRTRGGALASSMLGYSTTSSNDVSVHGRKGRLDVSINEFDGLRFRPSSRYPGSPLTRLRHAAGSLAALPRAVRSQRAGGAYVLSYTEEWRHFLRCVRGEVEVESGLAAGREATRIARAAIESADAGAAVRVDRAGADRRAAATPT